MVWNPSLCFYYWLSIKHNRTQPKGKYIIILQSFAKLIRTKPNSKLKMMGINYNLIGSLIGRAMACQAMCWRFEFSPINYMGRYRSGYNEAVLKTVCPKGRVGSNPTLSVMAGCPSGLRYFTANEVIIKNDPRVQISSLSFIKEINIKFLIVVIVNYWFLYNFCICCIRNKLYL